MQPRQRTLRKSISLAFGIQVLGYGIIFVLNVLLARWLGQAHYGEYIFIKNAVTTIGLFGTLGLSGAATRYVTAYAVSGKNALLMAFVRVSFYVVVGMSLLLALAGMLFLAWFPPGDMPLFWIQAGLGLAVLYALHTLYTQVLRALRYVLLAFAPTDIVRPLLMLLFTALAIFVGRLPVLQGALAGYALSYVLVTGFQVWVTTRHLARQTGAVRKVPLKTWLQYGMESLFFRATIMLRTEIPPLLLGFAMGAEAVALFAVAERAVYLINFIFTAVRRIFEPMIAPLYEAGKLQELQVVHARLTRQSLYLTLLAALLLVLFAAPLLRLFGAEFVQARSLIFFLLPGPLFNVASGHAGSLLLYAGYEHRVRRIAGFSAFSLLLLLGFLTPQWGLHGAAASVSAAIVIQNSLFYLAAKRHTGLYLPVRTFLPFGRLV